MIRAYPERAASHGVSGSATIQCAVDRDGKFTSCVVLSESPPGAGFGAAGIRLSSLFQMQSTLSDGSSVAGRFYQFPVTFGTSPRD